MEQPGIRLGSEGAWLELTRTAEEHWRVTADWCSCLTADFTAYLSPAEVVDFATRVLSRLRAPSAERFREAVTPGRTNPLVLMGQPVGDGFALFARLTPNGHDDACHLQMEIDPVDAAGLGELFDALRTALTG